MKRQRLSQTIGGYLSILAGSSFLFGIVIYVFYLSEIGYGNLNGDIERQLFFLNEHFLLLSVWYFVIYIAFGLALIGLQVTLTPILQAGSLQKACAVFAYLWAGLTITTGMLANVGGSMILGLFKQDSHAAQQLWYALQMLINGFGGGNELVGGCWLILVALTLGTKTYLEQWLRGSAILIGGIGLLTSLPILSELGGLFGLGCIIWLISLGLYMITQQNKHYV